ncbi:dienelactone hydrolase family protein [Marinobacter fonticola]|uniref:dienelactone hydrolase family protein n=1 Tax=Marinobacter fonticola TaxID=2603215 RepID=UPI0011E716BE|nr:dienelactone hydrolase family protein [Marinobacter fonticola]
MNFRTLRAGLPVALLLTLGTAQAALKTETVNYDVDGEPFTGYIAWDDRFEGERPGILVVHEWWGHNDFARQQAERLAELGYTAFALDMYGQGKVAQHPEDAKKFMQAAMGQEGAIKSRFTQAMELLKNRDTVNPEQIAAQGYCFGGGVVLNMARMGVDLDGVVSFHGSLGSDITAEPGSVTAAVQVHTGGADSFVPPDQVAAFVREMQVAEVNLGFFNYPGAQHSFTSPAADELAEKFEMPLAYDEKAAEESWESMKVFYEDIFAD